MLTLPDVFVISGALVSCTGSVSIHRMSIKEIQMNTFRYCVLSLGVVTVLVSGCARNDAAEQAMKDAEKLQKQAQEIAAQAAQQAQDSIAKANEAVQEGMEDARARMGEIQQDPKVQAEVDKANAQMEDAHAKVNQAMENANAQVEQMKKQMANQPPVTGK